VGQLGGTERTFASSDPDYLIWHFLDSKRKMQLMVMPNSLQRQHPGILQHGLHSPTGFPPHFPQRSLSTRSPQCLQKGIAGLKNDKHVNVGAEVAST